MFSVSGAFAESFFTASSRGAAEGNYHACQFTSRLFLGEKKKTDL
jgi:hypothetical protein